MPRIPKGKTDGLIFKYLCKQVNVVKKEKRIWVPKSYLKPSLEVKSWRVYILKLNCRFSGFRVSDAVGVG